MTTRRGFIIPLALMLIAVAVALVARISLRIPAERGRAQFFLEQTQAQMLGDGAYGLVEALLSGDKKKKSEKKEQESPRYLHLFEAINKWQQFKFTAERDGFSGEISVYCAVESGKIDINRFYDWEKKEYRKSDSAGGQFDGKKMLDWLSEKLDTIVSERSFADIYDELAKKRDTPFDDVGELLAHPGLKRFALWPEHVEQKQKTESSTAENAEKRAPALYDMFTTAGGNQGITLAVISDSVAWLAGAKAPALRSKEDGEKIGMLAQNAEKAVTAAEWNSALAPLTGKEYTNIPRELTAAAAATGLNNPVISLVVETSVGKARYKYAALLVPQTSQSPSVSYRIARVYRLL